MKIYYRMSGFKPDNQGIVFPDDKKKLIDFSHTSFLKAGGKELLSGKYDVTYILDCCDGWADDFRGLGKVFTLNVGKKFASLAFTLEMAKREDGKVLFLEDDYLWRPDTIKHIEKALDHFPVVSPYDHPAHYTEERFKDYDFELTMFDNKTYRKCPSNTHTFGTTSKILRDNWDCLVDKKGRARHDHPAFTELNKKAQMWCPTYSFATHLAGDCIAPNVEWILPS